MTQASTCGDVPAGGSTAPWPAHRVTLGILHHGDQRNSTLTYITCGQQCCQPTGVWSVQRAQVGSAGTGVSEELTQAEALFAFELICNAAFLGGQCKTWPGRFEVL